MKNFKATFSTIVIIILSIQTFSQKNFLGTWKGELIQLILRQVH